MAKSENQKLKLLYIAQILKEYTDADHPITTKALIERLEKLDIKAERKSIYSDMECLRQFGMDIEYLASRSEGGYYLASREFELAELKILVDMVQSSRFLTKKKSRELIKKLEGMAGRHEASQLQRAVYVGNRVKAENETVYYGVDMIHRAIQENRGISFQYYEYTVGKELQYRKGGELYLVSPYYLTWQNENYYLIGVDEQLGEIRHYRVDRMKKIELLQSGRRAQELFQDFDIAEYTNAAFGMFGGTKTSVLLECHSSLIGVVIDRFGKELPVRKSDGEHFTVRIDVVLSSQFYGWLAGLGNRTKILSPDAAVKEYRTYLKGIVDLYS
ncbi:MAG: WYL domain-containing protein [Lachnospiraceae bacterium]|nr:WYL domain-containing protein [Lachnospiraceae bacterium]